MNTTKTSEKPCRQCGASTGHPSGVCVLCQPNWPNEDTTASAAQHTAWIVRRMEGLSRETFGLFIDQSTRPIMKLIHREELEQVARHHNKLLAQRDELLAALEKIRAIVPKFDGTEHHGNYFWKLKNECEDIARTALRSAKPE